MATSRNPRVNRVAFASGGADLGAFANGSDGGANAASTAEETSAAATPTLTPVPQTAAAGPDEDGYDYDDTGDDAPVAAPAPTRAKSKKIVRKNYPVETAFTKELFDARRDWHMADPSRMEHFGGMASENAFLQAVARLGMEQIRKNQRAAQRLMRLFPENARTR